MKKYIQYPKFRFYALWLLLALGANSCIGDLNTTPIDKDIISSKNVYDNPEAYRQVLAKIYSVFA